MDEKYILELLPLPYRVVLLVNIGLVFWYVNILTCKHFQIDLPLVLKLTHPDVNINKMAANTRATLVKITLSNIINYSVYLFFYSNQLNAPLLSWFPLFAILFTIFILVSPHYFSDDYHVSIEGQRLSQTIKRVMRGGINPEIRNNDILLTDTLTSYNKTIIDFFVYLSSLFLGLESLPLNTGEIAKDHIEIYNLDLLLANFPSAIRFKQCLFEYQASNYQNKTHLFNAIKYSTAFLPTLCLILKRSGYLQSDSLWILFSFINSTFSFFWDISNDWNFGFFYKYLSGYTNLPILRSKMIYNIKFYMFAIAIDFQLRFLWVYKIIYKEPSTTSTFGSLILMLFTTELGAFTIQLLEIFRRWIWVFVKVETEYIKIKSVSDDFELQNIRP